ncbi:hypothetical protein QYF36_004831 [Acer negundo]|nr:hypothetical protein QYF36_004831 [Acer negundo]
MNMAITTDHVVNEGFRLPAVGYRRPWKRLFEGCEEKSLYFFTRLKNKNDEKDKRINRVTDSAKLLIYAENQWSRKPRYMAIWVMHEYRLDDCLLDQWNGCAILKDYVLCRIIKKKPIKGGRSNTNCDHEDQDQVESLLLAVD